MNEIVELKPVPSSKNVTDMSHKEIFEWVKAAYPDDYKLQAAVQTLVAEIDDDNRRFDALRGMVGVLELAARMPAPRVKKRGWFS